MYVSLNFLACKKKEGLISQLSILKQDMHEPKLTNIGLSMTGNLLYGLTKQKSTFGVVMESSIIGLVLVMNYNFII
jgi:hypothetical protein